MKENKLNNVLQLVGAENLTPGNGWFKFSCLFARHTHYSGKDSSPSAGVTIDVGVSIYNCFSCGTKMPIDAALTELLVLNKQEGIDNSRVVAALDFITSSEDELIDPSDFYFDDEKKNNFFEFPETWLQSFSPVESSKPALEYIANRKGGGLPLQVLKDFDVRFDNARQMVCFL